MNEVSDSPAFLLECKRTNRLRNQLWQDVFLVVLRHCRDNGRQWRGTGQAVLLRKGSAQLVEIEIFLGLVRVSVRLIVLNESICNVGACSHESLVLWDVLCVLLGGPFNFLRCHSHGSHGEKNNTAPRRKMFSITKSDTSCTWWGLRLIRSKKLVVEACARVQFRLSKIIIPSENSRVRIPNTCPLSCPFLSFHFTSYTSPLPSNIQSCSNAGLPP